MASSSLHLLRLASTHPSHRHRQKQNFSSSYTLYSCNLRSSFSSSKTTLRASRSYPNYLITHKHKLQLISPKTLQNPNFFTSSSTKTASSSLKTICAAPCENISPEIQKNTPKIPATEILILVLVYFIPCLKRLNFGTYLLFKYPVLKSAIYPLVQFIGFYNSIPTVGLIAILTLFICCVRYRNFNKFNSLQAWGMDFVLVISSLIRHFLVNPDPLAEALGLKFRLLNVAELLVSQTCIHSCLEYLEAAPWIGEKEKASVASDVVHPPIDTLTHIMEVVLKNNADKDRSEGKSVVLKLLRENKSLLSDVNANEIFNKNIYTSCQSCLSSLLNLFKQAAELAYIETYVIDQISKEVHDLLWLLDILEDRQAADEFALMWATQQELATFHSKFRTSNHHLVSRITARLFVSIGSGKMLTTEETRRLLLQTWLQPLIDDFYQLVGFCKSFDQKVVEESIGKTILSLPLEDQESIFFVWLDCFGKSGHEYCPNLQNAFEVWYRRTMMKTSSLSFPSNLSSSSFRLNLPYLSLLPLLFLLIMAIIF